MHIQMPVPFLYTDNEHVETETKSAVLLVTSVKTQS